jgi:hypothetical protein
VPDFVLKGRFADLVKLDLRALEQQMGFDVETTRSWWRRLIRRGPAVQRASNSV